jgi:methionyl-tRNA formyltransferase
MRVFFFGNNRVAVQALAYLADREELVGLAVHPDDRARYRSELVTLADLPPERVFEGPQLADPGTIERIRALAPELGVSVLYDYIFTPALLRIFPRGVINLHPSLLPWNRGQYPNVWSIVEGTPSGVTLHWIDEGVDTGDLIAQRPVAVDPVDTGATLYRKLESAGVSLFEETWPSIREGSCARQPQLRGSGSHHRTRDVDALDEIDLDAPTTARALLNLLRARTFRPYESAWFRTPDGGRVYVRVSLERAE